jgi:hypothetical protein
MTVLSTTATWIAGVRQKRGTNAISQVRSARAYMFAAEGGRKSRHVDDAFATRGGASR